MAKPATLPTWATDTNYSSGPDNGTPTKATPSAGYIAQGQVPGNFFGSQYWNWLLFWVCSWLSWINTRGTPTTRTKVLPIDLPLAYATWPPVDTQWDRVLTSPRYAWEAQLATAVLFIPLELPPGSVLKTISVRGKNAVGTSGNVISFGLYSWTFDATETTAAAGYEGSTNLALGTSEQTATKTFSSPPTIAETSRYAVRILSDDVGDQVWGVQVTYDDPTMYGE